MNLPFVEFGLSGVDVMRDRRSKAEYWDSIGVRTLHRVCEVEEGEQLLTQIDEADRRYYLTCRAIGGITALHEAAREDRVELADLIIRSAGSEYRDSVIYCVDGGGETPLHMAASSAMVKTLMRRMKAESRQMFIKAQNRWGWTALHTAAWFDKVEVADLIVRSADSEYRDSVIYCVDGDDHMTPLHKARSSAMVKTLLDGLKSETRQQFIKHTDRQGRTALHTAASMDRVETVEQIIRLADSKDRDSVIYCVDGMGRTPLHWAESSGMAHKLLDGLKPQIIQQFIRHKERMGWTAASFAVRDNKRALFMYLWSRSDTSTQIYLFPGQGKEYGDSLLMWAGWSGDKEVLRFLLDNIPEDSWEEIVTAVNKQIGTTLTQLLILHQMVDSIAEILKPLSLEKRRAQLDVKPKWLYYTHSYSSFELALKPPKQLWEYLHYLIFHARRITVLKSSNNQKMNSERVSHKLLKVLHLLGNEYGATSPASIFQYQLSSYMITSLDGTDGQTPTVTVRISALSLTDDMSMTAYPFNYLLFQAVTTSESEGLTKYAMSFGDMSSAAVFLVDWEINTAASRDSRLSVCDMVKIVIGKTNKVYLNGKPKVS